MKQPLIKSFLPRSLFGRATLIVLVPLLTVLGVMSVVFIQRLYEDVTRQMTLTVADEIQLLLDRVAAGPERATSLDAARAIAEPLNIEVIFPAPEVAPRREIIDLSGRTIVDTLGAELPGLIAVDLEQQGGLVRIAVASEIGDLAFDVRRGRLSARNPHQFLVLIGVTALVMTVIALLYLRGQVRPIRRLAVAATAFGKGRRVQYRPSGATEVREAGRAFLEMRDRIERQIEQRTMMLSGVSHDLRTPLTRMRLALEFIEDRQTAKDLSRDVDEMESMLSAFLDFAKGAAADEDPEIVNLAELVDHCAAKAKRAGHDVETSVAHDDLSLGVHRVALERALDNLVSNACRYGKNVRISLIDGFDSVRLVVEDDGPGIAEHDRDAAIKPFNRLDAARNQDAGSGVGLGLAIASDVARQHGGSLELGTSSLGGLSATIILPR